MASTAGSKGSIFLLCLLSPIMAGAGDWKFSSGISLSERYSDNAQLDASGQEREEWITEVTPRFTAKRNGARLKVNADYSLQGLLYAEDSSNSKMRHSLNGRANAELLEEWFFLDATARVSHELKSLVAGAGLGDPVGIGNTTSVGAYSLSPYLKHRFGSYANVEARIARDGVFIGDSSVPDAATTRYTLNAASGNYFHPLSWSASYARTDQNNDSATDSSSERAALNARYQLSRKYGLLAQAGSEKNDFSGAGAVKDYSYYGLGAFYTPSRRFSADLYYNGSDNGSFLSGSVTAKPTVRTTVNASAGKRAYGRSYSLGLAHRTRHSNWSMRYQDDLTTSQQQYLQYAGSDFYYECPTGIEPYFPTVLPSDPAACVLKRRDYYAQTQLGQTYVSKALTGTVSHSLRKNTWTLSLYRNKREFQGLAGGEDITRGLLAEWSLRVAPRTTYSLSGGMSQVEASAGGREDDLWNIALVASHQFQQKLTGSLEVRHQERESNQANGDYKENSLAARLNMSF
jgi:uncharacterized protein (PEP-CTERM system associated)